MDIKRILLNGYCIVCRTIFGVDKNKTVFISFGGKNYSDNPRAISEKIYQLDEKMKIVWIFNKPEEKEKCVPSYVNCVSSSMYRLYKEIATAGAFVSNFSLYKIPKSKKQLFIETWHGDKAFKKVLYDASPERKKFDISLEIEGYCDYAIAGSEYGKKQYRSAFRYGGKILMEGTPRNDRLFNFNVVEAKKIKKLLNIADDVKLLLYAPTLRRDAEKGQKMQKIDLSKTLNTLEKKDNKKWICLLRAHPAVSGLLNKNDDTRIIEVSNYEDMADLLLISDMLITDYSSCAGDFALLRRPIVLFQEDKEEYLKNDRTFYFNIEDSPYFVANNQEELESLINRIDSELAKKNCDEILEFYGDVETGHASEEIAKIIVNGKNKR